MIVAIDGPAGSGKSTISKKVAHHLKYFYLDTGAMYRAVTLAILKQKVDIHNPEAVLSVAQKLAIKLSYKRGRVKVFLDGEDVSEEIRLPYVTNEVKHVAKLPKVRDILVRLQRHIAGNQSVVLEGRDTTTVVFPHADVKIYLDGSQEERARRRFIELQEKGISVTFEEILEDQRKRDESDFNREVGALKKAQDAHIIDTSGMGIEEVVQAVLKIVKQTKTEFSLFYAIAGLFCVFIIKLLFRAKVYGKENIPISGGFILASNHASHIDPMIVGGGARRQLHYLARENLFTVNRFMGWLLRNCNAHPIRRGEADRKALGLAEKLLKKRCGILLFPEGTRSLDGTIGDAKAGVGFLACRTGYPVVPAYVHNSQKALRKGSKKIEFVKVTVIYGEPMYFTNYKLEQSNRERYESASNDIMNAIRSLQKECV